jgi:hypothetical protein
MTLESRVLGVAPELDSERDYPPLVGSPLTTFAEDPDAGEHHHGVEIVKQLLR